MNASNVLLKLKIASPCLARWEDMGGDERVRFCDQCRKNVYNLSAMTTAEANELLGAKNGNLCARIYQRTDGTVLTEDCPVGMARHWRRIKLTVAGAITALFCTISYAVGEPEPVAEVHEKVVSSVETWLGIKLPAPPRHLMGKVRANIVVPPPQHLMGEVMYSQPQPTASASAPVQPAKK